MKSMDKRAIKSMIQALERIGDALNRMSDEGLRELCNKIFDATEDRDLPTWTDLRNLKEVLEEMGEV